MASNSQEFYVIDAVDKHSNIVRYLAFDEYNAELTMTSDVDTCLHFKTYDELARWLSAYKEEIKKKIKNQFSEEYNNFHVAKIIRTKLLLERLEDLG